MKKDWSTIRERYLRDDLPVRLGGLAANLSRIRSFANNEKNRSVVESLIDESKHFIEWTAHETGIETAAKLAELQVELALWQIRLNRIWPDVNQRGQIAEKSNHWSQQVLMVSGLLG